jgi:outer membrane lipoprotein SlyB
VIRRAAGTADAVADVMRTIALLVAFALVGCYTRTQAPVAGVGSGFAWNRAGIVTQVEQVVERVEGDPTAGAIAGALIGGVLFGRRGRPSLIGALAGAGVGAAASSGGAAQRTYHVLVAFDDGEYGMFVYRQWPALRPGDAVVLTPGGLVRR